MPTCNDAALFGISHWPSAGALVVVVVAAVFPALSLSSSLTVSSEEMTEVITEDSSTLVATDVQESIDDASLSSSRW
jgi:hypothetical protein